MKYFERYGIKHTSSTISDTIEIDTLNFVFDPPSLWQDSNSAFCPFRESLCFQHLRRLGNIIDIDREYVRCLQLREFVCTIVEGYNSLQNFPGNFHVVLVIGQAKVSRLFHGLQ